MFKFSTIFLSLSVALWSGGISYHSLIEEAIDYSIELKIIGADMAINDAKLDEVGSLYYPTLSVASNAQYTQGLGEGEDGVTTVGDTVLNSTTQYESSVALRLDYDIYDFGVRHVKTQMAQIDRDLVDYTLEESYQNLRLTVLDIYTKLLSFKKQHQRYKELQVFQEEVLRHKKRLYRAGEVDKVFVSRQSIVIANTKTKLEQLESSIGRTLLQLSFYTGRSYVKGIQCKPLENIQVTSLRYMDSWQQAELALERKKKRKELELLENQLYPSIKLYGRYNFYGQGSERCTIWCALYDMEARNNVIGVSASFVIFNGFQTEATENRLKAELLQLELKNELAERQFMQEQLELGESVKYTRRDVKNYKDTIAQQKQKSKMNGRLFDVREINAIVKVEDKIELVYQQMELDASLIEESSKLKEIEIMNAKIRI